LFLPSPSPAPEQVRCGINSARARQQSPKIRILKIGGTFWTKSELFLTKIRTVTFNCRPAGGNPAQRFRPPPLCFGEQNRKIFLTFFNCAPPKFFQFTPLNKIFDFNLRSKLFNGVKETKIFLFCLPADAGIAETLSHSQPAFGGQSRRAKIPSPQPLPFCPPAWASPRFFSAEIYLRILNQLYQFINRRFQLLRSIFTIACIFGMMN